MLIINSLFKLANDDYYLMKHNEHNLNKSMKWKKKIYNKIL